MTSDPATAALQPVLAGLATKADLQQIRETMATKADLAILENNLRRQVAERETRLYKRLIVAMVVLIGVLDIFLIAVVPLLK